MRTAPKETPGVYIMPTWARTNILLHMCSYAARASYTIRHVRLLYYCTYYTITHVRFLMYIIYKYYAYLQVCDRRVVHVLLLLPQKVRRDRVERVGGELVVPLDGGQHVQLRGGGGDDCEKDN